MLNEAREILILEYAWIARRNFGKMYVFEGAKETVSQRHICPKAERVFQLKQYE